MITGRRPFLLSLLGSLALPSALTAAPRTPTRHVVIVGAGIAGLAAGVALRAAGVSITIIEARDRIGGRIHTSRRWPDLPIDLGASWIHGVDGNPLTALARAANAATVITRYDSAALHIDPALAARGVEDEAEDWAAAIVARAIAYAGDRDTDMSLRAAIETVAPAASLDPDRRAQLDFYISGHYEQEYAGSAAAMSAQTIDDNDVFPGDDALFPGGYDQIIRHLARGLDIIPQRAVTRIQWGGRGVVLHCADGSNMRADDVIVTVPLGVLKSGRIAFDPPLPKAKTRAIRQLGMGLLNKHWMRFDRVFWPADADWHEYLSADKGRWSEWVSLAKVHDTPVLLVFSAADRAEAIERETDAAIVADAMQVVRAMFGNNAPDPVATQITRWRHDPFALGAYSFNAVGSSNADRRALAAADTGHLHFAGEALSEAYPGTVHGALISGRDAAARLLKERASHG